MFCKDRTANPELGDENARCNPLRNSWAQSVCREHRRFCSRYEWDEWKFDGARHDPQVHDEETKDDDDAQATDDEEAANDAPQYVITGSVFVRA
jgi:hypothetical protein